MIRIVVFRFQLNILQLSNEIFINVEYIIEISFSKLEYIFRQEIERFTDSRRKENTSKRFKLCFRFYCHAFGAKCLKQMNFLSKDIKKENFIRVTSCSD